MNKIQKTVKYTIIACVLFIFLFFSFIFLLSFKFFENTYLDNEKNNISKQDSIYVDGKIVSYERPIFVNEFYSDTIVSGDTVAIGYVFVYYK